MKTLHAPRAWWLASLGLCLAFVSGCGSSAEFELVPVSGVVTLDGKPVPYTQVVFIPQGSGDKVNPGPSSAATCDDQGRYQLKTVRGDDGAVVGTHSVRISSTGPPRPATVGDTDLGPPRKDAFPAQYNVSSTLTFDVPSSGTTEADFKLTTQP
jgi:hypothetical protein